MGLLTFILATSIAVLPPHKYDRPFHGNLVITEHQNILEQCGWHVACMRGPYRDFRGVFCEISIPKQGETIYSLNYSKWYGKVDWWWTKQFIKHERGHCNGWPGYHPNQRLVKRK